MIHKSFDDMIGMGYNIIYADPPWNERPVAGK